MLQNRILHYSEYFNMLKLNFQRVPYELRILIIIKLNGMVVGIRVKGLKT